MSVFRKSEPDLVSPVVKDSGEFVRVTEPCSTGGFNVFFKKVSCEELSKDVLDPRIYTLERMVCDNLFIDPGQVVSILNSTDINTIEDLAGRVSEEAYIYLRDNLDSFDFEKNVTTVEPDKS